MNIGYTEEKRNTIYKILVSILFLGSIIFEKEAVKDGCRVSNGSLQAVKNAADLIGVNVQTLERALLMRDIHIGKTTILFVFLSSLLILFEIYFEIFLQCSTPLTFDAANRARGSLIKTLYGQLFSQIVAAMNTSSIFQSSNVFIGILDIAGMGTLT